jgi:hypothetical protein
MVRILTTYLDNYKKMKKTFIWHISLLAVRILFIIRLYYMVISGLG